MADQEPTTDGNDTEPTPAVATEPSRTTEPGTDWEAAYKGLQAKYNNLDARYKQAAAKTLDLQGQLEVLKLDLEKGAGQTKELQETVEQKGSKVSELEGQLGSLTQQLARKDLIIEEFPGLIDFEKQGLLPPGSSPDDLREVFQKFEATMGQQVGAGVQKKFEGATPPSPPGGEEAVTPNADDLYDQMMDVAGRDPQKFAKLQKMYDQLTQA